MLFFPKMYQPSIYTVDYHKLYDFGIRCLLFDLDNTIGLLDQEKVDQRTKKLFEQLQKKFHVAIVSNNSSQSRVSKFAESLGCDYFHFAMKPSTRCLKMTAKKFNVKPQKICMIGDQLLTDILAANRFGSYCCLVDPLSQKDLKITSFNRWVEKLILKHYEKKNLMKKGEYYG